MSTDEGEAKAQEHRAMFIETSAKAGFNIKVPTCHQCILLLFAYPWLFKHLTTLTKLLNPVAFVPQDRRIPSWTGRTVISKAGRNGRHKPQTFHRVVSFGRCCSGGAEIRWLLLLRFAEFLCSEKLYSSSAFFWLERHIELVLWLMGWRPVFDIHRGEANFCVQICLPSCHTITVLKPRDIKSSINIRLQYSAILFRKQIQLFSYIRATQCSERRL